jgi:hypothetical protein
MPASRNRARHERRSLPGMTGTVPIRKWCLASRETLRVSPDRACDCGTADKTIEVRLMRIAVAIYVLVHGFCHLVGFLVPWKLIATKEEPYRTTLLAGTIDVGDAGIRMVGLLWLAAALAFVAVGVGILASAPWWRNATLVLTAVSLVLCVFGLPGAKIGILANLLLAAYLAAAHLGWLPKA